MVVVLRFLGRARPRQVGVLERDFEPTPEEPNQGPLPAKREDRPTSPTARSPEPATGKPNPARRKPQISPGDFVRKNWHLHPKAMKKLK